MVMIVLASDHAGFWLKEEIKKFFKKENITTIDVGAYNLDSDDDFSDFGKLANAKVLEDENNIGIYLCGSGIGMSIVANRNPKIRGALCNSVKYARLARAHNNANVLIMGGRFVKKFTAIKIVKEFLTTAFEGGKYARRMKKA